MSNLCSSHASPVLFPEVDHLKEHHTNGGIMVNISLANIGLGLKIVYGDPRNHPVIVLYHRETYGENAHDMHWLAYRSGGVTFLSKKVKWIRELYSRSEEEAKKKHGYSSAYYLYDAMADIASGMHI